jgi:hypothetical protein
MQGAVSVPSGYRNSVVASRMLENTRGKMSSLGG